MNIVISGYGRMGQAVEKQALKRRHSIVATIDNHKEWQNKQDLLREGDVLIDFSLPSVAATNIYKAFEQGLPVVTGTTAWYDRLEEISDYCTKNGHSLFYAPNFSVGVNIFFEINRRLAELINEQEQYHGQVEETHHIHKKDAPSGTAAKIADDITENIKRYSRWEKTTATDKNALPVISHRRDEVPGTHEVSYESAVDKITIRHDAKSREGFALGALLAAEFLQDKKGVFTMKDLLFSNF